MTDNIQTGNFAGAAVNIRTTETAGVHTPHHRDPEAIEELVALNETLDGSNHLGSIGGNTSLIDVTLSLDTNAYATGDVMADTQVVANAMRANDGTGVLQTIQVLDEDDQGIAFDLVFLSANNSIGTENAGVSVSDASARDILGLVSIASGDFVDVGSCRIATKSGIGLIVKTATGTRDIYVAAIARGAPTYTATGVKLRLGFLQD